MTTCRYIHLLEAGADNEKAQPYAEKLAMLAPSASHLVHMPSVRTQLALSVAASLWLAGLLAGLLSACCC